METVGLVEKIAIRDGGLWIAVQGSAEAFLPHVKKIENSNKDGKNQKKTEVVIREVVRRRTVDISDHFHAHITQLAQDLAMDRDQVYADVLLLAVENEPPSGGAPYPYSITAQKVVVVLPSGTRMVVPADVLIPHRTSNRTNKQMMTAIEAAHRYAAEREVVLRERPEDWIIAKTASI